MNLTNSARYRIYHLISVYISDFNGDGKPDNITFMIKRIKVHNSNALKDPLYRFPGNYGVEKFLELFSGKWIGSKRRLMTLQFCYGSNVCWERHILIAIKKNFEALEKT